MAAEQMLELLTEAWETQNPELLAEKWQAVFEFCRNSLAKQYELEKQLAEALKQIKILGG